VTAADDAVAGTITLHPGRPRPNITSTRAVLARRVGSGLPASAWPTRAAALYRLCGEAHRIAARAAVAAATGSAPDAPEPIAQALRFDALREHLRRIVLDWPAPLAGESASAAELRALSDCPLPCHDASADPDLGALRHWIGEHLLGESPASWLAAWDADPAAALARWTERARTPTARRLRACRAAAQAIELPLPPLPTPAESALGALLADCAGELRTNPAFALAPHWRGRVIESGCWARIDEPAPARYHDTWLRLGARIAETARLALPAAAAARRLRCGALAPVPGEGVGWCEMARGLLLHRVRIGAGSDSTTARIAECDVVAPTEWHFHPQGPVATALARLPARDADDAVRLLAVAFDPCVAVRVAGGTGNA
jgi:hypothetical protein